MVLGVSRLGRVDYRKEIALQGLTWFQLKVLKLVKRRGHDPGATLEGYVVVSPAKGDGASPQIERAVAGRTVHITEMERDAVARLKVERDNAMLVTFGVDVRHYLKTIRTHGIVVTDKHLWLEQAPPKM